MHFLSVIQHDDQWVGDDDSAGILRGHRVINPATPLLMSRVIYTVH
jgi:hypothetical protein